MAQSESHCLSPCLIHRLDRRELPVEPAPLVFREQSDDATAVKAVGVVHAHEIPHIPPTPPAPLPLAVVVAFRHSHLPLVRVSA